MKKTFFPLVMVTVLVLSACMPTPTPTLTPPTVTAIPPTSTPQGRTLLVTSPADSGPGTLRQTMQDAQPYDTITFDPSVFPPDAPVTIALSSILPEIRQGNLTIDASNAGVILDGSNITDPQHGLSISSDHNIVRGLQVTGFSNAGIGLFDGAQYNIIGGDRNVGEGPLGQGNLISGNGEFGIGLWGEDTSHNTIQGNYIGVNMDATATWGHARDGIHSNGATKNLIVDNVIGGNELAGVYLCCVLDGRNMVMENLIGVGPSGTPLGNGLAGVLVDRTSHNVVGPGNVIAHNHQEGVMFWEDTPYNTVTQNSIRDNGGGGISHTSTIQHTLQPPLIINFDLQTGMVTGAICPNCMVEIFSDSGDEGSVYEGQVKAEENGAFIFEKGASLAGPSLTSTATDSDGSTSEFSPPTQGNRQSLSLQVSNALPLLRLQTKPSNELADNRIGASFNELHSPDKGLVISALDLGLKRLDVQFGDVEAPIDWSLDEYKLPQEFDSFVDSLAENGIALNYMLHFWDTAGHAKGEELGNPRFQKEVEVQEFLDYVRFFVGHFKGRIPYYTIWSEQDACGPDSVKCIMPEDYVELVRQVIPVIREEDPRAKIVSGPNVLFYDRDDLFTLLRSDVVKQFDVISWHPLYEVFPDSETWGNYYYEYPAIIREIKQTASAHGFEGEYWGTEISWCSHELAWCVPYGQDREILKTDLLAAKYYARGIVMELGMDVSVGLGSHQSDAPWSYPTIRNLNTLMAGHRALEILVEIESDATHLTSYGFSLPNGDRLFAVWNDNLAVDYDPGVPSTLTFPGTSVTKVIGIDVLHGFEQELIFEIENGNLVIRNFLIKDYPIILRLID
jgi:hypothetical protein